MGGPRLILVLFLLLAAATAVALLVMAPFAPPEFRRRVYFALAGDLAIPAFAWFLIRGINTRDAWRPLWFAMAAPAALFVAGATLAALVGLGLLA